MVSASAVIYPNKNLSHPSIQQNGWRDREQYAMNIKRNMPFKFRTKQKILSYKYENNNLKIGTVKGDMISINVLSD